MAQIDYDAVIADLREQQAKMNADFENAITGIKTIMAMKARLPHVAPEVQPEAPPKSARPAEQRPTEQRRKYAFGRDPSQPTLADLAAAALPQNGDSMPVSEIRRKLAEAGRNVAHNVVYDILTRKDKHGRFKKDGRGMFSLNRDFVSSNGHGKTETQAQGPKPITLLDATEQILIGAGRPLHATAIVEGLKAFGKNTTIASVAGSLFQDSKGRFINTGQNTWDLVERTEEK